MQNSLPEIAVFAHVWSWIGTAALIAATLLALSLLVSFWVIGPTEVGLVRKRFGWRKLDSSNPVAFNGEAGYQAKRLSPGVHFKWWVLYAVTRHPMVQVPAGQHDCDARNSFRQASKGRDVGTVPSSIKARRNSKSHDESRGFCCAAIRRLRTLVWF